MCAKEKAINFIGSSEQAGKLDCLRNVSGDIKSLSPGHFHDPARLGV